MQKNKALLLILLFVTLLVLPSSPRAQDTAGVDATEDVVAAPTDSVAPTESASDQGMDFKKARAEMELRRKQLQEKQKGVKLDAKATITRKKADFKEQINLKREENMEKRKTEREAFKVQMTAIKDERKREILEKVDVKLSTLNRVRTDHLATAIDRLKTILDKAEAHAVTLKQDGKDTTALEASITAAKGAIDTAKAAVETQAGKEYILTITDEAKLQTDTHLTVRQLQADLKATVNTVMRAKEAVQNVLKNYNFKT